MSNNTRQKILFAIAQGATTFRQVMRQTGLSSGCVTHYFYNGYGTPFKNGEIICWTEGPNRKASGTLRLANNIAVIKRRGRVIGLGRCGKIGS